MKTKTIEERAEKYVWKEWTPECHFIAEESYIAGAKDQQYIDRLFIKQLIDKACEWFTVYLMEIGYPDDWMRDSPNMLSGEERFRKAMEE